MPMQQDDYHVWIAPLRIRMVNCVWRIVRNTADTDDIIQEVLMHILEKINLIRAHPNRTSLLLRICANKALDHLRRQKHRHETLSDLSTSAQTAASAHTSIPPRTPRQHLAESDQRTLLRTFLASLPAREAEAMTLLAFEELDYAEIAAAMDCNESTVRVLVNRARARFREHFSPEHFRNSDPREPLATNENRTDFPNDLNEP